VRDKDLITIEVLAVTNGHHFRNWVNF